MMGRPAATPPPSVSNGAGGGSRCPLRGGEAGMTEECALAIDAAVYLLDVLADAEAEAFV